MFLGLLTKDVYMPLWGIKHKSLWSKHLFICLTKTEGFWLYSEEMRKINPFHIFDFYPCLYLFVECIQLMLASFLQSKKSKNLKNWNTSMIFSSFKHFAYWILMSIMQQAIDFVQAVHENQEQYLMTKVKVSSESVVSTVETMKKYLIRNINYIHKDSWDSNS